MRDKATLEINLSHLRQNYVALCSLYPHSSAKLLAVVKSDAYGLGVDQVATSLAPHVYGFAVSTVSEALHLRNLGISNEIVVLTGWFSDEEYHQAVQHNITLTIATIEQAQYINTLKSSALPTNVYIKADTGMSRLGLVMDEIHQYLPQCLELFGRDNIILMSHFACSDDEGNAKNTKQAKQLLHLQQQYQLPYTSMNNSGGIIHDLVHDTYPRSGIALYGGWNHPKLLPVATLTAPVIAIRELTQGETIGYSATYTCMSDMRVAIVGIGYSSGIMRVQSGTSVYINGHYAQVLGVISMEMTAIDVSDITVAIGDRVEIFGQHISVATLAGQIGTISYELFTHLSPQLRRIYND